MNTFITVFIVTLATLITTIDVADSAALTAVIISAATTWVRTVVKILIEPKN